MNEERFYQLLSRKMAGIATAVELQELEHMLAQDKQLHQLYEQLTAPSPEIKEAEEEEADASFAVHSIKMQIQSEPLSHLEIKPVTAVKWLPRKKVLYLAAASIVVFLLAGFYQFVWQDVPFGNMADSLNEVVTKKGSQSTIQLPDGTRVSLNANSKLTYREDFGSANREVTLSGEGFFDVVKDSTKPFVIHTDKMNIKVLGTSFNIKNYPEDELIETALIHGKIEVTFEDRPSEKMFLKPGDKLVLRKNQETESAKHSGAGRPKIQLTSITPIEDSTLAETAWMNNKFAFSNVSLKEIANQLERRFDVEIEFADSALMEYSYTGIFEKESAARILELLSLSQKFSYVTKSNKIIIMK
jgi:ferric-dicitrate binding protein FerR (iron transport regulator)